MPDLKCYFLLACRAFPRVICNKIEVFHPEFITILLLGIITVGDVNNVILNILLHNEPGSSSQSQSFSLANGMKPIAAMSTNLLTCFKFDHRPLFFSQKATDKIVIIYLAQKANSLTILPTGTGQSGLQRYLTHFMLHQPTYRKQQFRNLQIVNLGQEISLIFYRVLGCTQPGFPA